MSTPLAATHRLDQTYVVDNQTHHMRLYCGVNPSADVTGFNMADRLGGGSIGVSQAINALLGLLGPFCDAAHTAFGVSTLQILSGSAWLPIATYNSAVAPTGVAGYTPAAQLTLSMRDTAFHKVRNLSLETEVTIPLKTNNPAGFGAPFTAWAQGFTQPQVIGSDLPWLWVRGRSDLYIGSFVSMVTDANDKLRRARGIA